MLLETSLSPGSSFPFLTMLFSGLLLFSLTLTVSGASEVYLWFSFCPFWVISLISMPSFTIYMALRFTLSFIGQIFTENLPCPRLSAGGYVLGYISVILFFQSISKPTSQK